MNEIFFHLILIAGMLFASVLVFYFKDLISAAIAFGVLSLLLSLEFFILQAPDVAIAEAGIGAGLTTAIFVIAIRGTERFEGGEP